MTEIKSVYVYPHELLRAVCTFAEEHRTGRDSPAVQRDQVDKSIIALRKVVLQLRWWHITRDIHVDHEAFHFLAACLEKHKFIPLRHVCTASEQEWVKQLLKARIIFLKNEGEKGYLECE